MIVRCLNNFCLGTLIFFVIIFLFTCWHQQILSHFQRLSFLSRQFCLALNCKVLYCLRIALAAAVHNSGFSWCENEKHLLSDYIKSLSRFRDGKSGLNEMKIFLSTKNLVYNVYNADHDRSWKKATHQEISFDLFFNLFLRLLSLFTIFSSFMPL